MLLVNYVAENAIYTELLMIDKHPTIEIDGEAGKVEDIKCGMEMEVSGEFFETTNSSTARKIEVVTHSGDKMSIEDGRIDIISGEYAFSDGQRIKLAPGKKITGVKKSGYAGRIFTAFTELKLGDYINVRANTRHRAICWQMR